MDRNEPERIPIISALAAQRGQMACHGFKGSRRNDDNGPAARRSKRSSVHHCRYFLSEIFVAKPQIIGAHHKDLMRVFGRHRAPKLRSYAVTSPQLSALAPADEFAAPSVL